MSDLSAFASAVRESSLRRLRQVPPGKENWRIDAEAMSFADTAQHLFDADNWLIRKLEEPLLAPIVGRAHLADVSSRLEFEALLNSLEVSGARRIAVIDSTGGDELTRTIPDARFGGDVTVWWIIVRGNLDHEIHHRGQVAAYLRVLQSVNQRR